MENYNYEEEYRVLREQNNELVQKVQYWKMAAAQREEEKLTLMKEINELRLKISHIKNVSSTQSMKLEAILQAGGEKSLSYLVKASSEIANAMELTKSYIKDLQELGASAPRWSKIGGTPASEKSERVHRVPPTLVGGRSIQPVVSLSRTLFDTNNIVLRGTNQNRSTERAVPMHLLQGPYIPLTRIEDEIRGNNNGIDTGRNGELDNSNEELDLEDEVISEVDEFETTPHLEVVTEDLEPEEENITPLRATLDDGLEGPSWLLGPPPDVRPSTSNIRHKEEPDSTTGVIEPGGEVPTSERQQTSLREECNNSNISVRVSFSPTVRRRRVVTSPPPTSPCRTSTFSPKLNSTRRNSACDRVLKVLLTKMKFQADESSADVTPPKRIKTERLMSLDAPSPSGATDARVIVLDSSNDIGMKNVSVRSYKRDKHCDGSKRIELTTEHVDQGERENFDCIEMNIQDGQDKQSGYAALSRKERHKLRVQRSTTATPDSDSNIQNRNDGAEHNDHSRPAGNSEHRSASRKDRPKGREKQIKNQSEDNSLNASSDGQASQNVSHDRSEHSERTDRNHGRHERSDQDEHSEQNEGSGRRDRQCGSRSASRERSVLPEHSDRNKRSGRTDSGERNQSTERIGRNELNMFNYNCMSARDSDSESVSDSVTEGRSRRARKAIVYKEKPLNRKMRR